MMNKFFAKFKVKKKTQSLKVPSKINPHHHWMILLWTSLFMTALLIIFSLYLLYQIESEQIFKVKAPVTQEISPIREKLLKSVLESFDQKAQKEKEIKASSVIYEDPSL